MLSLLRGSARGLFIQTGGPSARRLLQEAFPLEARPPRDLWDRAREDQTLLLFSRRDLDRGRLETFLADASPVDILAHLINADLEAPLRVRPLPRAILFRLSGDRERAMEQIARDFDARPGKLKQLLRWSGRHPVVLCFTEKNLNRPLALADLQPDVLYFDSPYEKLFHRLRGRALEYFNEAAGGEAWRNLEIRVYDVWERYDLQARRVRLVLEDLDLGLVLGEGWGKDFARILMAVSVYRFRLATFIAPERIKALLLGLEYDAEGNRLVDLDLFEGRVKIGWQGQADRKEDRSALGRRLRQALRLELLPETLARLDAFEAQLIEAQGFRP
ncbi:hypothetical protein KAR29_00160 [Aminithiophilus ramosus]|uniref:Uncharacterized protein n=2 Tax=Synergistales TaxID=649776 RepID=A0A9Q7AFS8_9BACT|nr:hypothetical protein [Aminithiophilus ramosus]QTX32404.1 hypothetical protein KAR29_00160 [Aminithiophilus ramosus]QVL36281.1 hypothetical protein KIH16_00160 [Synergistota bacterium]